MRSLLVLHLKNDALVLIFSLNPIISLDTQHLCKYLICRSDRKLSDEELQLCALLKLEVVQFALIKQMLIAESLQSGFLDKKMAVKLYSDQHPHIPQPLLQVDLLKVGSIYEFFMQNEQCFH